MRHVTMGCLVFLTAVGCAHTPPKELESARQAFRHANVPPTTQLAPEEVYEAHRALIRADRAFKAGASTGEVKDLSYVAVRKAQLAEAKARARVEADRRADAAARVRELELRKQTHLQGELDAARERLRAQAEADRQAAVMAEQSQLDARRAEEARVQAEARQAELERLRADVQRREAELEAERQARQQAEQRANTALQQLADVAKVRQEARGLVITLSGSLLFKTGEATLLPIARERLEQVAEALKQSEQQSFVVEGHTDSVGPAEYNQELSYLRALAVRDFLVQRGVSEEKLRVRGHGETQPVAPNATSEGRANNRRVEIVVTSRG